VALEKHQAQGLLCLFLYLLEAVVHVSLLHALVSHLLVEAEAHRGWFLVFLVFLDPVAVVVAQARVAPWMTSNLEHTKQTLCSPHRQQHQLCWVDLIP
jgi:hypothetical protein